MRPFSISFGGAGFLGSFHCGVVAALQKELGSDLLRICQSAAGSSAGALAAAGLLTGVDSHDMLEFLNSMLSTHTTFINKFFSSRQANDRKELWCLTPGEQLQRQLHTNLHRLWPDNAHQLVHKKIRVCVSELRIYPPSFKPRFYDEFQSKDELIDVLILSSLVPFWAGRPPRIKAEQYTGWNFDGGFTENWPSAGKNTVYVSCFEGDSFQIGPVRKGKAFGSVPFRGQHISVSLQNLHALFQGLNPRDPEFIRRMFTLGEERALAWLREYEKVVQ